MDIKGCWERCREFHGHTCKGLLIGFMASLYAIRLLGLKEHDDEDVRPQHVVDGADHVAEAGHESVKPFQLEAPERRRMRGCAKKPKREMRKN